MHEIRRSAWTAYVLGPALVLMRETQARLSGGLRILVDSRVPEGKGVSSSAAVEVATMRAVAALAKYDRLTGTELGRLCQVAENRVVGAPCGIMDQMTSALGRENELLALLCQPATVEGYVAIPDGVALWGIDSGIRHAVSGSDYTSVRTGAFMGYRILADLAGLDAKACQRRSGRDRSRGSIVEWLPGKCDAGGISSAICGRHTAGDDRAGISRPLWWHDRSR